jgi:quinol-cytochrome oxidoreductase complex cytochrome b subunit
MYSEQYLLFGIFLLLGLWAVIAFTIYVLKPVQTHWAMEKARKIIAEGKVRNNWQFHNIYRMLAKSKDDLEAQKLWQRLDEMK